MRFGRPCTDRILRAGIVRSLEFIFRHRCRTCQRRRDVRRTVFAEASTVRLSPSSPVPPKSRNSTESRRTEHGIRTLRASWRGPPKLQEARNSGWSQLSRDCSGQHLDIGIDLCRSNACEAKQQSLARVPARGGTTATQSGLATGRRTMRRAGRTRSWPPRRRPRTPRARTFKAGSSPCWRAARGSPRQTKTRDSKAGRRPAAGVGSDTLSFRNVRGREDYRTPGTQPHPRSAVLRPNTMDTTHHKYSGSGFESGIGALAASTINSFDRLAAHCRDAGYSGGR